MHCVNLAKDPSLRFSSSEVSAEGQPALPPVESIEPTGASVRARLGSATARGVGTSVALLSAGAALLLPTARGSTDNYKCWETANTVVGGIAYMIQQCQQACCNSGDMWRKMQACNNGSLPASRGTADILLGAEGRIGNDDDGSGHYARLLANVSAPTQPFQACMLGYVQNPIDNGSTLLRAHMAVFLGCALVALWGMRALQRP